MARSVAARPRGQPRSLAVRGTGWCRRCPCWRAATRDGLEESHDSGSPTPLALDGEGRPALVIDWKSDVAPTPETISHYRSQVWSYLDATGTGAGLIVFLSSGIAERLIRSVITPDL